MAYRFLLIAVLLLLAFVDPVYAKWWIVRAADNVYQTREQAEADVKRVCKEDSPSRTPGTAE